MKTKFLIPLMAGLALLWACKGKSNGDYEVVNNSSTADSVRKDSSAASQPKLLSSALFLGFEN